MLRVISGCLGALPFFVSLMMNLEPSFLILKKIWTLWLLGVWNDLILTFSPFFNRVGK